MSAHLPGNSVTPASDESRQLETPSGQNRFVTPPGARLLLRIDAAFEAVLGLLLVLSPATGLYDALSLPNPATQPVVVICGLLLLPLLPILWLASRAPRRQLLVTLATIHGAGAVIFALWVLAANSGFRPAGAAFTLAVAAMLAILALLQGRAASVVA
jgi:hypothetical protein